MYVYMYVCMYVCMYVYQWHSQPFLDGRATVHACNYIIIDNYTNTYIRMLTFMRAFKYLKSVCTLS